ncbi:hypothetical protein EYZ11_006927 [Aspergillus tanneri]|uniref:Uncharacterized protein n=1 Tax=Aspergillus tanneri TaxID=1220188 RepID=A0A4V3UP36_9EURO|nr:hypothetical protein EYZ11_006927 [Aspergillus tanneri]
MSPPGEEREYIYATRTIIVDSLEIGRLAHEGNNGCQMSLFQAEVFTAQNITVRLSKPI